MKHFNLSDVELCWLHGFKAFHKNLDEVANPFKPGTRLAHYWQEGWWEACFNTGGLSDAYTQHYQQVDVDSIAS